jgi:hypothetical protein
MLNLLLNQEKVKEFGELTPIIEGMKSATAVDGFRVDEVKVLPPSYQSVYFRLEGIY